MSESCRIAVGLTEVVDIWIKCTNESTRRLYNADIMDEPIEFTSNHTAQVSDELGRRMLDYYDGRVVRYTTAEDDSNDGGSQSTSDEESAENGSEEPDDDAGF